MVLSTIFCSCRPARRQVRGVKCFYLLHLQDPTSSWLVLPLRGGVIETKKSAPEQKSAPSRGQKSAPRGKKKCSQEHLSRALLPSVLFLAINNKVVEANNYTSYLSPFLHHYCRHCNAALTPPPTPPTPSPPAAAGQRPTPRCH